MNLNDLLEEMEVIRVAGDARGALTGLAYDSRRVKPGNAFFALAGQRSDGARFVGDAVGAGALAVVSVPGVAVEGAAHVEVRDPRLALAQAANALYRHPSRDLEVVGVTGTNGKTTTTWMLESIFRAAGRSAGLLGTTGARFASQRRETSFTTPEAPELQSLLAEMRDARVQEVAMEISSHALAQRRAWGVECDVTVFTNLTRDHLDFHGSMEAYLDAKLMLFDGRNGTTRKSVTAVIHFEDAYAPAVIEAARRGDARVAGFGARRSRALLESAPGVWLDAVEPRERGLSITLEPLGFAGAEGGGARRVELPLLGRHNASNAAAAYAAARALGIAERAIESGLAGMPAVPGRLERVDEGQRFLVVVDYAHTPDALERALSAAREHSRGRLLLVFGCGGDRDRGKRPLMGAVASRAADQVWITNDNPRGEDPAAIAREILSGATGKAKPIVVELDRRLAISRALDSAREGDLVLIAGKGHETTQTIGSHVLPFDDREVAGELLRRRRPA